MKLSIIIPCYNEITTIQTIIEKVKSVKLSDIDKEIIIINDGSTDGTTQILDRFANDPEVKVLHHQKNQGKGAAIRTGIKAVSGNIVLIQDADLEYNPEEYPQLIQPIVQGKYKVVYGSRERNHANKRHSGITFYLGALFLTFLTNWLYWAKLTDEATCYKVFSAKLIKSIPLTCQRFEFCPEVTAKILKRKIPIKEVPISYNPRNKANGKKIGFRDGVEAIWTLIKYRFVD